MLLRPSLPVGASLSPSTAAAVCQIRNVLPHSIVAWNSRASVALATTQAKAQHATFKPSSPQALPAGRLQQKLSDIRKKTKVSQEYTIGERHIVIKKAGKQSNANYSKFKIRTKERKPSLAKKLLTPGSHVTERSRY